MGRGSTGTCWACVGWFSAPEGVMGKEAFVLKVLLSPKGPKGP